MVGMYGHSHVDTNCPACGYGFTVSTVTGAAVSTSWQFSSWTSVPHIPEVKPRELTRNEIYMPRMLDCRAIASRQRPRRPREAQRMPRPDVWGVAVRAYRDRIGGKP
jgi:hypothetical protein